MDQTKQCANFRRILPFDKATEGQTDIKHGLWQTLISMSLLTIVGEKLPPASQRSSLEMKIRTWFKYHINLHSVYFLSVPIFQKRYKSPWHPISRERVTIYTLSSISRNDSPASITRLKVFVQAPKHSLKDRPLPHICPSTWDDIQHSHSASQRSFRQASKTRPPHQIQAGDILFSLLLAVGTASVNPMLN